ncbi:conserved hypothetical protein [Verticillium alfalfae VaMs.102]|uniref:DUF3669 domain-containing protein n=1 Tax=Verticillium alfalfae (strain VaMs.102 / ATCC MYA-4576 / FGSC 10136) TaxID=526221 RepID=C9SPH4_VERA1|nr:conserved hypothetical protein [Verticillium alfalfae VaMs.102]EEY20689.1 conserved hypothetical protein [Verticillium alfalfae VaMs.102]
MNIGVQRRRATFCTNNMDTSIITITGSESTVERIGMGHCGSVWASQSSIALKREDGGPGQSLLDEHGIHQDYTSCDALLSERNPPVQESARRLLVEKYCPEPSRESMLADPKNEDCIIRAYLGRRRFRPRAASRFAAFSLRNYPLHADQMDDLGLDQPIYAAAVMPQALAFMHWRARVDANDV